MASSMKNIRTKKESKFYADDSSNIQESEDQKPMEDKFYKEAAREILRDAVKERQTKEARRGVSVCQTVSCPSLWLGQLRGCRVRIFSCDPSCMNDMGIGRGGHIPNFRF